MKYFAGVFALVLALVTAAFAGQYEMRPKYLDLDPHDGIMDPGTWTNPYVISPSDDPYGPRYQVRPKYLDLDPHDGIMDPGTWTNPYVIEPVP